MSSEETAKKVQASAKGMFTKAKRNMLKLMDSGCDAEIIESRFLDVKRTYFKVQEKHEEYLSLLNLENLDAAQQQEWIDEIDREFDAAEQQKISYVRKGVQVKYEEDKRVQVEEANNVKEQALLVRKLEEAAFNKQVGNLIDLIKAEEDADNPLVDLAKDGLSELKQQMDVCKKSHQGYIAALSKVDDNDIQWITKLQDDVYKMTIEVARLAKRKEEKVCQERSACIRLQKIKLPTFDGDIRDYPRFKADFTKQVMPQYKSNHSAAAFALKSCLSKETLNVVRNVDDDLDEMWLRLDNKYGKPSRLIDAVMNEIKGTKVVSEGDDKSFIQFVDIVECGYRDLLRMHLEREIANSTAVSMIEEKLPRDVRKLWALKISKDGSKVEEDNKFPYLLKFMLQQKRAIEYESHSLRNSKNIYARTHYVSKEGEEEKRDNQEGKPSARCVMHCAVPHGLESCRIFLEKNPEEKVKVLKDNRMCFSCLKGGHPSSKCWIRKQCSADGCSRYHHRLLHDCSVTGWGLHAIVESRESQGDCILQVMAIKSVSRCSNPLSVMFDGGATISLITFHRAKALNLIGTKVEMTITKVGGKQERIESYEYSLPLIDKQGIEVEFQVYGIDEISTEVKEIDISSVIHMFKGVAASDVQRPIGKVDVLIGFNYAGFHPVRRQHAGHLLFLTNRFGKCLGGSHPLIRENTRKVVKDGTVHHVKIITVRDFYDTEVMGVSCSPRCGGCKCGKCPLGSKNYTLKEEHELNLIKEGLFHVGDHWMARYPWVRDPNELPNNYNAAVAKLRSQERRLLKNKELANLYNSQIEDMLDRDVARKVTQEELDRYEGPIHYISHHEVIRIDSKSTPCRIVFNSSASYGGHTLNEYWAKGPDLINNLLGVLLRFREEYVALSGDIKKMYHAVKISELDQHTHRFVWRNYRVDDKPDIYVISSVSFGDKPAGNIATMALRGTAEMGRDKFPEAYEVIISNVYVDDILDSVEDEDQATKIKRDIEELIKPGGFKVKEWFTTHMEDKDSNPGSTLQGSSDLHAFLNDKSSENPKILGMKWDSGVDEFRFETNLNLSPKNGKQRTGVDINPSSVSYDTVPVLTKRIVLSQVNSIFDPMGLVGPFTVKAKMLMRKLWSGEVKLLGWDDPIPKPYMEEWFCFFRDLSEMNNISFKRCIKPPGAIGNPSIIVFCDGSNDAFGACVYVRWKKADGTFKCSLIASKNRITPLKRMTIVRSELCGAVLGVRLKSFIEAEFRLKFEKGYFFVDSRIVQAMIQSESYGFNTFVAVRIGEIQEASNPKDWYWIDGGVNIADWLTRGKSPNELDQCSLWQNGAEFLNLPEKEWPLIREEYSGDVPERRKIVMNVVGEGERSLSCRINIDKYSEYKRLIRVTARVLLMFQKAEKLSFKNVSKDLKPNDIEKAEFFWFAEAQKLLSDDVKSGKLKRLTPRMTEKGLLVVGGRAQKWVAMTYDNKELILLPYNHRISRLYAEHVHRTGGHLGVAATSSKIRVRVWIINVHRMVKSIRNKCVFCIIRRALFLEQVMAPLPIERLKPSPPWYAISLDLFGPLEVRGEVNKRSRGKVYGVLFNCLASRAVHCEIASNYSTEALLMVIRKFVALRGYPSKVFSDSGSQLVAASKEMKEFIRGIKRDELSQYGAENGMEWKFTPADAPWQNGCSESLVKSIKLALKAAIGNQVLTVQELLTVCYEAANLVNERPIGRHPQDPDDGVYLSPNHLLLGRATSRVPSGPFENSANSLNRFKLVEQIVDTFWKQWTQDYFPSLLIHQKWHVDKRNVMCGDVVFFKQDSSQIRGDWKIARVSKVYPSDDGHVRKVELEYKNKNCDKYTTVLRPVQRLVVIAPVTDVDS